MCTKDKVIEAFVDDKFQSLLRDASGKIEKILNNFIIFENTKDQKTKISQRVISRIKSNESLNEKLDRKDYIDKWKFVDSTKDNIQKIICNELPDLIGFRINCYFKNDEKGIFDDLLIWLKKNHCSDIILENKPVAKQKNNHDIYKIACKYKELSNFYCFEVQIKSLLHDTWGEVEHSIIYKCKDFDSRRELKKAIVEGLYNILDGVDKQLNKLYLNKLNLEDIKYELFYVYTKTNFVNNTDILGEHYENFYNLKDYINDYKKCMNEYLSNKIVEAAYAKRKLADFKLNIPVEVIEEKIDKYKFSMICKIARNLFDFDSNKIFLKYIISGILNYANNDIEDEFIDDTQDHSLNDIENDILTALTCILKDKGDSTL